MGFMIVCRLRPKTGLAFFVKKLLKTRIMYVIMKPNSMLKLKLYKFQFKKCSEKEK